VRGVRGCVCGVVGGGVWGVRVCALAFVLFWWGSGRC